MLTSASAYKTYYTSYLQVVFQTSVARAGYISNIYSIVSCSWAIIISIAFKYTDTYKWGALAAVPIMILMSGLLIQFREPGTSIAVLVVVEVLFAMAAATIYQVEQVAIMAAVPHEYLATGLALLDLVTSIGGSVGQTIAGTVWTQIVPVRITEYLPMESKQQAAALYASLKDVLKQPWDSPERQAVVHAYGDAQKIMVIIGTATFIPCFLWMLMLKNYRMSEHQQRKGLQA